jgi:hypothetical protein
MYLILVLCFPPVVQVVLVGPLPAAVVAAASAVLVGPLPAAVAASVAASADVVASFAAGVACPAHRVLSEDFHVVVPGSHVSAVADCPAVATTIAPVVGSCSHKAAVVAAAAAHLCHDCACCPY